MQEGFADQWLRHRAARPTAMVVVALLALGCLYVVARFAWLALGAGLSDAPPPPRVNTPAVAAQRIESLARWHLFGNPAPVADTRSAVDAPETALNLTLRGIVAQDDPKLGRAIIADANGVEKMYRGGSEMPGGVTIDGVYADRVMLSRNGVLETLRLPKPSESARPVSANARNTLPGGPIPGPNLTNTAPPEPVPGTPITGAPAMAASNIDWNAATQKLGVDPRELAKQVTVLPVTENGKFIGVRLNAGQGHPALSKLGLRPDDVVTSVNGIPLDNFSRAQAVQDSLANSKTVNVTVKRGDKTETLSVTLE